MAVAFNLVNGVLVGTELARGGAHLVGRCSLTPGFHS